MMNKYFTRYAATSMLVCGLSAAATAEELDGFETENQADRTVILGFPTHGTNSYNGEFIHDYSEVTNQPLVAAPNGPFYQIGLLNPDGPREDLITADSDTSRTIATSSEMVENFIAPGLYDPFDPVFNKRFSELGTLFFGSRGVYDRVPIVDYDDCDPTDFANAFCYKPGANRDPTLAEWNSVRARLTISPVADDRYRVRVAIRGGIKQSLYTMWLVGVTDNFEEVPILTASPLGGMPNIILTDIDGNGESVVAVPQDILRPCESGPGKGCELYVSLVWHPDGAAFGGTPSIDLVGDPALPNTPGLPVGVVSVAHVFFPLQGEPLFDIREIYRNNRL